MKDKYIPDFIMAVIWKNHGNDSKNFIRKENNGYESSLDDTLLVSLKEIRNTLEDIFGEEEK